MIKFFRKTRQQLLTENKTGKYLKYAIGEIVLIVIGILIALSINNWNEKRKQTLVEINILNGLKTDILKDTIDINKNIRDFKALIKNDSILIEHLTNNRNKNSKIENLFLQNFAYQESIIILHHSHFDEAKLKGLSLIKKTTLRDSISRLYEFRYKILEQTENSVKMFKVYNELISDKMSSAFLVNDKGVFSINDNFYNELLHDDNFTYLLIMHQSLTKEKLYIIYNPILKSALEVVDAIDIELEKLKE